MSAIFGVLYLDGQPVLKEELERMYVTLADYGRDGGGIRVQANVGLGQRLMCFTPEDRFDRQPLLGANGRVTLVFDGRIDNRPELLDSLEISAGEGNVLPDSAFVLRA